MKISWLLVFFYTELVNFQELQAYDVADLLKQYFRELPECLLTNKLSEVFINIFICKFPISSSMKKKLIMFIIYTPTKKK